MPPPPAAGCGGSAGPGCGADGRGGRRRRRQSFRSLLPRSSARLSLPWVVVGPGCRGCSPWLSLALASAARWLSRSAALVVAALALVVAVAGRRLSPARLSVVADRSGRCPRSLCWSDSRLGSSRSGPAGLLLAARSRWLPGAASDAGRRSARARARRARAPGRSGWRSLARVAGSAALRLAALRGVGSDRRLALSARRPSGPAGAVAPLGAVNAAAAGLGGPDGVDQLPLAHGAGALQAERGELLQLGQHHRVQSEPLRRRGRPTRRGAVLHFGDICHVCPFVAGTACPVLMHHRAAAVCSLAYGSLSS